MALNSKIAILINSLRRNESLKKNSTVRTPQQNGVVERRNRTLIEAARSMLSESSLATQFCPEAISTACFTQNRSLIVKRFKKTPYELFRGRKPSKRSTEERAANSSQPQGEQPPPEKTQSGTPQILNPSTSTSSVSEQQPISTILSKPSTSKPEASFSTQNPKKP